MKRLDNSSSNIQDAHWFQDKSDRRSSQHPVVKAVYQPVANYIASLVDCPAQASVLDVGCGNGFLQWQLEKTFYRVAGVDYSESMLLANPCDEKHLASCTDLPFGENTFDIVVAANLLHHLPEVRRLKTVSEMKRVTTRCVFSLEPNRYNPFMFMFSMAYPEERMMLDFSTKYMEKLYGKAGLRNVESWARGWIVPNKAPLWWLPVGRWLTRTPLSKLGFYVCAAGWTE